MKKPTLGGSLFIHNGIEFDYCFKEAIESLLQLCDEVVILDADSNDGTSEALKELTDKHSGKLLLYSAQWEAGKGYERLSELANKAKSYLQTDWHFMGQADEVVHEDSFDAIRTAIESGKGDSYACFRYNLYRDFNTCVKKDSNRKPCSDVIIRLGRTNINAIGDAESLRAVNCSADYIDKIKIFHYGFVRTGDALIDKVIDMQTWFWESKDAVDKKVIAMKESGAGFDASKIIPESEFVKLDYPHPKFTKDWINKHDE